MAPVRFPKIRLAAGTMILWETVLAPIETKRGHGETYAQQVRFDGRTLRVQEWIDVNYALLMDMDTGEFVVAPLGRWMRGDD